MNEAGCLRGAGLGPETLPLAASDSALLALAAARAGYGLLFASDIALREDLAAARLRGVPPASLPRLPFSTVMSPGPRGPALQTFVAWLRKEFAGETA